MAESSAAARSDAKRTDDSAHHANSNEHPRHQTTTYRRDEGEHSGRGRGRKRTDRRDGPSYGRGGMHRVNNWRDERGPRPRKNVIRDPKEYEHLFFASPNRTDHGGIIFKGEVSECDICCRESDLFAVGPCLHPICIECGIRLRILCKNEACPKCRAVVDTLYFVQYPGDWSDYKLPTKYVEHKDAEKHKIKLANDYIARCYDSYLAHQCLICEKKGEKRLFEKFAQLNQHMYMVHRFEFCDICVENLNLFTRERRFYSHLELERHLEIGDSDDRSLRGHPQCLFCEKRFLDEEFQYKHLRKEHFFCQICDADGKSNYFFPEHEDLLKHYRVKHIVCDEGECLQLGIAFRTDTELKLHKSRDHAAGPQVLNLDFHFSDRSAAGPSRGGRGTTGRGAPVTRSKLPSQRSIPRIGLIPSEPTQENRPADSSDVVIVPSAQNDPIVPSLRYRGPQFTLQGSDFPRLGKTAQSSGTPDSAEPWKNNKDNKDITKSQKAASGFKPESNPSEPNAASSSAWFIDDDEQFPPHRPHPSTEQQAERKQDENIQKESSRVQTEATSETSAVESPWSKVMKRPQSLSNVATALAQNGFPSLPAAAPAPAKPANNLPPGSAWAKKSRSVMQAPSSQFNNFTSTAYATANPTRKSKQLPVPDLWPQESVPENWDDIEDSPSQGSPPKMTLKDIITLKDAQIKKKETKKNKSKQQSGLSNKQSDQPREAKMEEKSESARSEFDDPFPALPSHTPENEVENHPTTKSSFSFSELLSSAFSSVLGNTPKDDKKETADSAAVEFAIKTVDTSSSVVFPKLGEEVVGKVSHENTKMATERLPPGLDSPSGLGSMDLAPPPGFGPPPGFDNPAAKAVGSEAQGSFIDMSKPLGESNSVGISKASKRGGGKKGKK